jgi:hypothetical protein
MATPPPPTRLVAPPPPSTRIDNSSSDSSGYNDECPHVKEVSSYELLHFNCLVQLLNVHVHFQTQELEKKLAIAQKEVQQARIRMTTKHLLDISMLKERRRRSRRRTWPERRRRRRPARRRRRAKAPKMSGLGGSSPLKVVQCLSLLRTAS